MKGKIRPGLLVLLVLTVCVGLINIWLNIANDSVKNSLLSARNKETVERMSVEPEISSGDVEPEEMPSIVFMFEQTHPDDEGGRIVFLDNCGNMYWTDDLVVNRLTWMEIYAEFVDGRLDDVLKWEKRCEADEVYEKYQVLKNVVKNEELELVRDFEQEPTIETDSFAWRGFYFGEDKKLSLITLREEISLVTHRANDENANKICEWFEELIKDDTRAEVQSTNSEEPLNTTDQSYYKEPTEHDIMVDEATGLAYVKNQVLVSANLDVSKKTIGELAYMIGAEIVGYIELTNDYQLEFKEDKTTEELNEWIDYLNNHSDVSYASLNLVYEHVPE